MIRALLLLLVAGFVPLNAESAACEQLIECLAKAKAKNDECVSSHNTANDAKHECRNETLHENLLDLIQQRTAHYENCLRAKAPSAGDVENEKKKTKCQSILKKNPKREKSPHMDEKKTRRSAKKEKNGNVQKQCFRDARRIKLQCQQISKCCTVSKLCRDTSAIDEKINAKKEEIKQAMAQCRAEHGKKGPKKHKTHGGGHRKKNPAVVATN